MAKNTFLQNLRPASFKNVPFEVTSEDFTGGRNVVVHEFVQRNKPYVEDLGRKTRRVRFDAWIAASIDNNWNPFEQRDALIAAIEEGGVGQFVSPFFGTLQGHVIDYSVKQQSTQDGGMVVLSLDFVEAGELNFQVTAIQDTRGRVSDRVAIGYQRAESDFAKVFSTYKMPGFVTDDATAMLRQLSSELTGIRRAKGVVAQVAAGNLGAISGLATPLGLAKHVTALIKDITNLGDLHQFSRPPVRGNTPARQQQAANSAAFVHLVRTAAIVRQTELASNLGQTSDRYSADSTALRSTPALLTREELTAQRRMVSERITTELMDLSDLGIYEDTRAALVALRTDAIAHMTTEGETLARTFFTSCCDNTNWWGFMPSLVLAYRWYGVLTDDVINDRNHIPNPLFVEPNARIELLHNLPN